MTFDEYQAKSRETAVYPNINKNIIYPLLGLAGETGEVCEKFKKYLRDEKDFRETRNEMIMELGDVLWYLAAVASELDISLSTVAKFNLQKLNSRKEREKLHGDGDER